ncbi:MAG: extracellular solute-binding protein [Candidatus Sumerlaeaceae bacterium]
MNRLAAVATAVLGVTLLFGCKEFLSPHVSPEADADLIVAKTIAAADRSSALGAGGHKRTTLTLNNFPEADQPLEQDFVQQLVELFEQRNPDISVQYSPWQYSPDSFIERARNGTLTDVVEVDVSQMPPIIDLNAAADLTENVALSDQIRAMNPEVFRVVSRNGRTYGVPLELHTMALFFNRKIVDRALHPSPPPKEETTGTEKKSPEKKKGKGADAEPRDFLEDEPMVLAQYYPQQRGYYQPREEEDPQQQSSRRGRQEVQDYYNMQPQQPSSRRRGSSQTYQYQQQQQGSQGYNPYDNQQQDPRYGRQQPTLYAPPDEDDARQRRRRDRDEAPVSAEPGSLGRRRDEHTTRSRKADATLNEDVLTSEAEAASLQTTETKVEEHVTSTIRTEGLPRDWDTFIRFAVKLTDHDTGVYGYAPVLFAKEGGREFCQWAVQAGLQIQTSTSGTVQLEVNTPAAAEVAQFLKDLRWRFDVMPPPEKCTYDGLIRLFAEGKLAMMMLPADAVTIQRLLKLGMSLDDIGIAALPRGPKNGYHLTYGKCLVANSQLDRDRRAAAFKWLLFMADPEILRLREQFFFRQQERTGAPRVPLYVTARQQQLYDETKQFRMLPFYMDYEPELAYRLTLEPAYYRDRLYESLALGIFPVIKTQDSDPVQAAAQLGADFTQQYLSGPKAPENIIKKTIKEMLIF